jgi:GDPmannose 4,6-dehydratase|tara:strand:- start:56 stop:1063 length:1008 start_codon:yes stop_codon:yes gene_type:complete
MKKAIITGVTGQDGGYLAKLLLDKGYKVYGAQRRNTGKRYWRLDELGITDKIEFVDIDLGEPYNIEKVIEKVQPDEFYNLAAQSFVGLSFEQPQVTTITNSLGVLNILEVIRNKFPKIKFYQASTSEMFGKVIETPQKETTPFHPRSPYGVAKAYSHYLTQNYRESYGLFACSGILFNHESPMRGEEFVTRKITKGLVEYTRTGKVLELGNIESYRDWGHAEDYVEAMWLMLQQDEPEDFVISTGKTIQIKDFITRCLDELNIAYEFNGHEVIDKHNRKHIIKTNPKFFRPAEVDLLVGDSTRAKEKLLWRPKHTLKTLVRDMIKEDVKRRKNIN